MDYMNVSFVHVVPLLVLLTGGIARNMYLPLFPPAPCYFGKWWLIVAGTGRVDASLSMDGGF